MSLTNSELQGWLQGISLRSIRMHLKKPSLGLSLFLLGFNGMYFHPMIFPQSQFDPAPLRTFRYLFLSLVLVTIGAALEMRASNWWLIRRKPVWVFLTIAAIGWMTVHSVVEGEPIISVSYTSFPFYWLILVPAVGLRRQNWAWIWVMFLIQAPFGVVYSVRAFFIEQVVTRMELNYLVGKNFLAICLYMSVFLFLFLPALRGRALIGIAMGLFGFHILQAFFYTSRLPILLLPVEILLVFLGYFRIYGLGRAFHRIIPVVANVGLVILIFWFSWIAMGENFANLFEKAYDPFVQRMLEKGTVMDTILENERWYESQSVLATMKPTDWLTGQGLSARWSALSFAGGEERRMVHNTWLNAFYWGGILLFLAIALPFFGVIRVFVRTRSPVVLACASYLLLTYAKFVSYVITTSTHEWILFCLALGVCAWEEFQLDAAKRSARGHTRAMTLPRRAG